MKVVQFHQVKNYEYTNGQYMYTIFIDMKLSKSGKSKPSFKKRLTREVVITLYTARQFLPGLFQRQFFLILHLVLPVVDFSTDWVNAGNGYFSLVSF